MVIQCLELSDVNIDIFVLFKKLFVPRNYYHFLYFDEWVLSKVWSLESN